MAEKLIKRTPCIGVCSTTYGDDICRGCRRFRHEIPFVPAKKTGGFCFGNKIAPIFYNTLQDSGAFPIELDVDALTHGRKIILKPYDGTIHDAESNEKIAQFELKSNVIFDEVRAGGRIFKC